MNFPIDIHLKQKLRTFAIQNELNETDFVSKKIFLFFFDFHPMLKEPQKFCLQPHYLKKQITKQLSGTWQISKGTKSKNLVSVAFAL